MAEEVITEKLLGTYNELMTFFPEVVQSFINIFLLILLVTIYSFLVWKFYKFIGQKNLFDFNLNKYNRSEHPAISKFIAGSFYLLEYIIILPFLVFIWFAGFSIFLILLSNNLDIQTILFLSVTIIGAIRMTSYIPKEGEKIAKEIAKIIPYTLLAVFILDPNFFDFSRVISHFSQLPSLFKNILIYISFIFSLELVLRFFELFFKFLGLHDEEENEEEIKDNVVKKN
jgi:hypothetical protein